MIVEILMKLCYKFSYSDELSNKEGAICQEVSRRSPKEYNRSESKKDSIQPALQYLNLQIPAINFIISIYIFIQYWTIKQP